MERLRRALRAMSLFAGTGIVAFGLTRSSSGSQQNWLFCLLSGGVLIALGVWPRSRENQNQENRPTVNVMAALTLVFGLIAIQLARMQLLSSSTISGQSGLDPATGDAFSNPRSLNRALSIRRGSIFDRNGSVLAESIKRDGVFTRRYPSRDASYVCGYFSPLKYGVAGIERAFDEALTGNDSGDRFEREIDRLLGRNPTGADLVLTLDVALQERAQSHLERHIGAIILLEVASGAVLTIASNPHIDPNQLVAVDRKSAIAAEQYWNSLNADPERPLLVRATSGLYTPGSTFKTITASAAIETGIAGPDDVYTDNGELDVDGHVIIEENRPDESIDQWTLTDGLAYSLNVVFAQIGLELGADRLRDYAERFGFGADIPFDIPVTPGQISSTSDFLENPAALADTAFGQGELLTTPLGMALVSAAIANRGEMMRPYLVERIVDAAGRTMSSISPEIWRRPVNQSTADTVRDLMINTVEHGYAGNAAIEGLTVGGKTGTAETGNEAPHAWFIGFAGNPEPAFAIAVVLEHGGAGTQEPLLIARDMLAMAMGAD